jgi:hypothetical protein
VAFADLVAAMDEVAMADLGGETVVYAPAPENGNPVPITGIFDSKFQLEKGGEQAGVEATTPAVFFRFSDLPVDPEFDEPTLTIRGCNYRVIERMPDDQGGIVLTLRKHTG